MFVGVQVDHLKEKDNFALLEQARIIYSAGFFLTASAESMLTAAKHAAANNKVYCVNISAPFLLQVVPSVYACRAQTYGRGKSTTVAMLCGTMHVCRLQHVHLCDAN